MDQVAVTMVTMAPGTGIPFVALCGAVWCLLGKHFQQTVLPVSQRIGWSKGGASEPRLKTQITARLICLSQPPRAADEDGHAAYTSPSNGGPQLPRKCLKRA